MSPRRQRFERITHTCHFTPHQLQASEILRWAMDAMCEGVKDQIYPLRILVQEHQWSVVIVGFEVTWLRPFTFFDATTITVDTGMVMHDGKRQVFGYTMQISANGEDVVRMVTQTHPVGLTGGDAMDALPCGVPDHLRALLEEDEVTAEPAPRFTGQEQRARAEFGDPIGERRTPFTLRRHEAEIADMWQNMALASLSGRAREAMAFDGGDPRLRDGLARPLASMSAELRRPVYAQDEGVIETRAYFAADHVAYVHKVLGAKRGPSEDSRNLCATIIEHMDGTTAS